MSDLPHVARSPVASHVASMPRTYRQIFDAGSIAAHAAIAARRAARAAHAEIWRAFPPSGVAICVVAEDAPGLLARVSAALVAHELDVVAAQIYSRELEGRAPEAIDLFWVRRIRGTSPGEADIVALSGTLDAIIGGGAGLEELRRIAPPPGTRTEARLRFETGLLDGTTILTVQGNDRPGLLFMISTALYAERVRIIHSDVSTFEGRVFDRFHLTEMDGSPLPRARLLGIQNATLAAIDR